MMQNLNTTEFKSGMNNENVVILDVRTAEEYASGHIPGAVNMDFYKPDFFDQVMDLDSSKSYYVYCRSGARSASAAQMMAENGIDAVYNLLGGILGWDGEVE